jgi:hypothetical protein
MISIHLIQSGEVEMSIKGDTGGIINVNLSRNCFRQPQRLATAMNFNFNLVTITPRHDDCDAISFFAAVEYYIHFSDNSFVAPPPTR